MQRRSRMPYFWGAGRCAPGGSDPQIRTRPRFLYNAYTPKFHHPVFTRSEVIVLTNKQTDAAENASNALRYATTLGWVNMSSGPSWQHGSRYRVSKTSLFLSFVRSSNH